MSIDPKFVELTADVLGLFFIKWESLPLGRPLELLHKLHEYVLMGTTNYRPSTSQTGDNERPKRLKSIKIPAKLCLDERLWAQICRFCLETIRKSRKNMLVVSILANICLKHCQPDLGLDAAQFRAFHTLCLTKSTTAS